MRESLSKGIGASAYAMAGSMALVAVLLGGAGLFSAHGNFVGQWHNVDLALNTANMKCGQCLFNISDHGFTLRGDHVNVTLAESYVDSSSNMRRNYVRSVFVGVGVGVSVVFAVVFFVVSGWLEKEAALARLKESDKGRFRVFADSLVGLLKGKKKKG